VPTPTCPRGGDRPSLWPRALRPERRATATAVASPAATGKRLCRAIVVPRPSVVAPGPTAYSTQLQSAHHPLPARAFSSDIVSRIIYPRGHIASSSCKQYRGRRRIFFVRNPPTISLCETPRISVQRNLPRTSHRCAYDFPRHRWQRRYQRTTTTAAAPPSFCRYVPYSTVMNDYLANLNLSTFIHLWTVTENTGSCRDEHHTRCSLKKNSS